MHWDSSIINYVGVLSISVAKTYSVGLALYWRARIGCSVSSYWQWWATNLITPPPVGGWGIVFGRFLSFFLCQQHYEKKAGPICMKFSGKVWSDHGTSWLHFGSVRVNGSAGHRSICLLSKLLPVELDISFALAWWQHFCPWRLTSLSSVCMKISFARWQQGVGFVVPRTTACFLLN